VLERGWEREWKGVPGGGLSQGLFQLFQQHPEAPLLLLEGTSVEDGCRFNTSVLDANVELRVGRTNGKFVDRPRDCRSTIVVDGGYLDTSGASPIVELTQALRPLVSAYNAKHPASCVVPYMVQIDNGFDSGARAANDTKPSELAVPLSTLSETRIARAAEARTAAALEFNQAFGKITVVQRGR